MYLSFNEILSPILKKTNFYFLFIYFSLVLKSWLHFLNHGFGRRRVKGIEHRTKFQLNLHPSGINTVLIDLWFIGKTKFEQNRSRNRIRIRTRRTSFLDELQAICVGVSLHESHESIPLPRTPHHILRLDSRRFSIDELRIHIHRLNHPFLIDHVESRYVSYLRRRVEHRRLFEPKNRHSVRSVSGFRQPHVRHRLLVRALDELNLRLNHQYRVERPSVS